MDIIMECKNVDYSYPLTTEPAIKHLNLQMNDYVKLILAIGKSFFLLK